MQTVVFEVGDWRFAIPASVVEQIVPLVEVAPIPGTPHVVEGVIEVRGQLVPVFGLRRRFAMLERAAELWEHLILVRARGQLVAIRADRALDLLDLPETSIEPVAPLTTAAPGIGAIARTPTGVLLVHDPASFLSGPEAEALDHVLARLPGRPGEPPERSE